MRQTSSAILIFMLNYRMLLMNVKSTGGLVDFVLYRRLLDCICFYLYQFKEHNNSLSPGYDLRGRRTYFVLRKYIAHGKEVDCYEHQILNIT